MKIFLLKTAFSTMQSISKDLKERQIGYNIVPNNSDKLACSL